MLIEPKSVEAKSAGGIILPDDVKDRKEFAQQEGVIVAASPLAFSYASEEAWDGQAPKVGERVSYAKYAGALIKGKDGKEYRVVNDKDLFAVLD